MASRGRVVGVGWVHFVEKEGGNWGDWGDWPSSSAKYHGYTAYTQAIRIGNGLLAAFAAEYMHKSQLMDVSHLGVGSESGGAKFVCFYPVSPRVVCVEGGC